MNREILDEIENPIQDTYEVDAEPFYAAKSVNQLLLSILVLFGYLLVTARTFDFLIIAEENSSIPLGFGILLFWLNLSGMINASKSERFQEQDSWKKYVGSVGNLLFFIPSCVILFSSFGSLFPGYGF